MKCALGNTLLPEVVVGDGVLGGADAGVVGHGELSVHGHAGHVISRLLHLKNILLVVQSLVIKFTNKILTLWVVYIPQSSTYLDSVDSKHPDGVVDVSRGEPLLDPWSGGEQLDEEIP